MARPFNDDMVLSHNRTRGPALFDPAHAMPPGEFANPLYDGADPYVVRHGDEYFTCCTGPGGRLEVWRSASLLERGTCRVVWTPPRSGWNRAEVWAPELHHVRGEWFLYYAASNGRNANHRMGVLRSTSGDAQGPYEDLGPMYTGDDVASKRNNRWAIDGTPLELNGQLYFAWSGWADHRDVQHLYIARMSDPATISSDRVQLAPNNCHPWEHVNECRRQRGLHEGPAFLHRHGRVCLVYSCSGSWETTYKLGLLTMDDTADPMNPCSWTKHAKPAMTSTADVFGIGHCSFTTSACGREDWILFHSKKSRVHGWLRSVHAQRFTWTAAGLPDFGRPLSPGERMSVPGTAPARPMRFAA